MNARKPDMPPLPRTPFSRGCSHTRVPAPHRQCAPWSSSRRHPTVHDHTSTDDRAGSARGEARRHRGEFLSRHEIPGWLARLHRRSGCLRIERGGRDAPDPSSVHGQRRAVAPSQPRLSPALVTPGSARPLSGCRSRSAYLPELLYAILVTHVGAQQWPPAQAGPPAGSPLTCCEHPQCPCRQYRRPCRGPPRCAGSGGPP